MPKRTKNYHFWRLEKLADPEIAKGYLNAALEEPLELFLEALLNIVQAKSSPKPKIEQ
jgi:DNA-binding phage protein